MLDTESMAIIVLATVIGLNLGHDAMYGVQAAFFAESFSVTSRYTGAGIGYHLAAVFGGGIAPLVATALLATGSNGKLLVGVYMAVMCLITVVAVLLARETKDLRLPRGAGDAGARGAVHAPASAQRVAVAVAAGLTMRGGYQPPFHSATWRAPSRPSSARPCASPAASR